MTSGLVRPVAVSAHHAAGLASVFADQHGGPFAARQRTVLAPLPACGPTTRDEVAVLAPDRPRTGGATRLRLVSVFRQGWVTLLVALLRHAPMPQGRFVPEPWPVVPPLEEEVPVPVRAMPKAA